MSAHSGLLRARKHGRVNPVLKINDHATGGRRTKDILGGPKGWGPKKKVANVEIYVIFEVFAFCGGRTKTDFKDRALHILHRILLGQTTNRGPLLRHRHIRLLPILLHIFIRCAIRLHNNMIFLLSIFLRSPLVVAKQPITPR